MLAKPRSRPSVLEPLPACAVRVMHCAFGVLCSRVSSPHVLQPAALVGVEVRDVLQGLAQAPAGLPARAIRLARPVAAAVLQQGVLEAVVVAARWRHCAGAQHAGLVSGKSAGWDHPLSKGTHSWCQGYPCASPQHHAEYLWPDPVRKEAPNNSTTTL